MAAPSRAARRPRGLGLGAAHGLGHGRAPGAAALRGDRNRYQTRLPARHRLRRTLDPPRRPLHRRRAGHPHRGTDARPRPRPRPDPAPRRRRGARPRQPRHRRHDGHHRQRLLLRAVRVRDVHQPLLRRSARAHRQAVAPDGAGGDRSRLLDRHRGGDPAGGADRTERRGGGRRGGAWRGARPRGRGRRSGPGRTALGSGGRMAAAVADSRRPCRSPTVSPRSSCSRCRGWTRRPWPGSRSWTSRPENRPRTYAPSPDPTRPDPTRPDPS